LNLHALDERILLKSFDLLLTLSQGALRYDGRLFFHLGSVSLETKNQHASSMRIQLTGEMS
jgi:hypothetical protein